MYLMILTHKEEKYLENLILSGYIESRLLTLFSAIFTICLLEYSEKVCDVNNNSAILNKHFHFC